MNEFTEKQIQRALRNHQLGYTPTANELAWLLRDCYGNYVAQSLDLTRAREELKAAPPPEADFDARLDEWREAMANELEALARNVREGEVP